MDRTKITQYLVGGFDQNFSYLVHDLATKSCAIVDPAGDLEPLFDAIEKEGGKVVSILVTHTHHDHIESIPAVLKRYPDVEIVAHINARGRLDHRYTCTFVESEDSISIGDTRLIVLHTPGHISDAVCYYLESDSASSDVGSIITGDTLFVEGCGRTTIADAPDLYASLTVLKSLPEDVIVYPGHNYGSRPFSTIGYEKEHNRFLLARDYGAFANERFDQ